MNCERAERSLAGRYKRKGSETRPCFYSALIASHVLCACARISAGKLVTSLGIGSVSGGRVVNGVKKSSSGAAALARKKEKTKRRTLTKEPDPRLLLTS